MTARVLIAACAAAYAALMPLSAPADTLTDQLLEPWRWTRFATDAGLPSNRVSSLTEAPDGSVWGVSAGEAVWFNGFRWQSVPNPAAALGRVATVVGGPDDDVALVAGGQLWRGRPGQMTSVLGPHPRVMNVVRLGAHRFLAQCDDNTLAIVDHDQATRLSPDGDTQQRVFEIWGLQGAGALVLADRGLYVYAGTTWRQILDENGARLMMRAVDGTSARHGMLYVQYPARLRGVWEWSETRDLHRVEALPTSMVTSLTLSSTGAGLVAYGSGDIWVATDGSWHELTGPQRDTLFSDAIFVKFTTNGDLWAGREQGLFLERHREERWHHYVSTRGKRWNDINDIVVAADGTIWAATDAGVVEHRRDGTSVTHDLGIGAPAVVTGVAFGNDGRVWAASGSDFTGTRVYDGSRWAPVKTGTPLDDVYVHRIIPDRSGHLWFLTLNTSNEWQPSIEPQNVGAFQYDGTRFEQWGPSQGLHGRIYAMADEPDGTLWFGTSRGLVRWTRGTWRTWDLSDQFLSNRVFTLAIDRNRRVWFADQSRGLGYLDGDTVGYVTTADGLVSEAVWGLAIGGAGELWVATHGGLGRYSDDVWATFDTASGLRATQLWPVVATPEYVYVGTASAGVARLSLAESYAPAPQVIAAPPAVSGRSALLRWTAYAWWGEQAPDRVRTRVRIDGAPWSPWTTDRERTLTDLSPGRHTFEIQSANQFGRHDDVSTAVAVVIPRPLTQQPQFFVPMAVLGTLAAGLAIALRLKQQRHRAAQEAAAEALQQAQKMESIGRLAGGVAHDFNNLLTVMLGNVDLLKQALVPGGAGSTELASIRLAAEQAGRLTRQLLAFARRQPLELQTVPINDVIRGTLGLVGRLLGERVTVETRLAPDAGAVRVDRSRFEQVLVNLLVNARDAMPDGGRITITTMNAVVGEDEARLIPDAGVGEHVVVEVVDTGEGMDASTLRHIFEPFYTTKRAGQGTGLGLATSYGTVRQGGGHIRVESRLGAGSTFRVYVPRVEEPAGPVAAVVTTPAGAVRETILVAEDQDVLRALVARVLRHQGYTVIEAANGAEALAIVQRGAQRIDLIVTDVVMPEMRGTELVRHVRARDPGVKVLFISGYPEDEPLADGALATGFLPKPFSPQVLGERVRTLLDGR